MNTAIGKKAASTLQVSKETKQLRRDVARADQLFAEGLARLQSDYKERLRHAIIGDEETPETTSPEPATTELQQTA